MKNPNIISIICRFFFFLKKIQAYTDTYVSAKGHTEEEIPGYEATCETTGLTNGVKCSECEYEK